MEKKLITEKGLQDLKDKLVYLKGTKKMEVAERIRIAREFGDLSENSEYEDAKNEQSLLENEIVELESIISTVEVLSDDKITGKEVTIGTKVTIYDYEFKEEVEYEITSTFQVDINNNKISNEAPFGRAMYGKKVNDEFEIERQGKKVKYKILKIKKVK